MGNGAQQTAQITSLVTRLGPGRFKDKGLRSDYNSGVEKTMQMDIREVCSGRGGRKTVGSNEE